MSKKIEKTGDGPVKKFVPVADAEADAEAHAEAQAQAEKIAKRGEEALAKGEARKFKPVAPAEFEQPKKE